MWGDGVGVCDGCQEGWEAGGEVGVEITLDAVGDQLADVGLVGGGGGGGGLDQLEDQCVPGLGGESEAVDVAIVGPEAGEEDVRADIEAGREGGGGRGGLGHGGGDWIYHGVRVPGIRDAVDPNPGCEEKYTALSIICPALQDTHGIYKI